MPCAQLLGLIRPHQRIPLSRPRRRAFCRLSRVLLLAPPTCSLTECRDVHWAKALSRDPLRSQADMGLQGKLPTADGLEQSPTCVRVTANPPHTITLQLALLGRCRLRKWLAATEQLLNLTMLYDLRTR